MVLAALPAARDDVRTLENTGSPTLISIVIPLFNEVGNVPLLIETLKVALDGMNYEVLFVDDGSIDGTTRALNLALPALSVRFRALFLARNFGQTTAIQAGVDAARGDIVVTMDGDMQNDPADIPLVVQTLIEQDADVVSGWRKDRRDRPLLRKFPSRVANLLIGRLTGVRLKDYGCTLKAYRASLLKGLRMYGEMHRFIPAWLATETSTGRIIEIPVRHHELRFGKSKYGISRTFRVILDLLLVRYFMKFRQRPGHFFGGLGLGLGALGGLILAYLLVIKVFQNEDIGGRPLLLMGVLLLIASMQFITTGLLGEMLSRIYYESQHLNSVKPSAGSA